MEEELLHGCSRESCSAAAGDAASKATFRVVFGSLIVMCGSFAYGCAIGYSSPAQSGITDDLGLSTAELPYPAPMAKSPQVLLYSLFGSLLTLGSMIGAIISGKTADFIGRKGAIWFLQLFFIMGWLSIVFAKDVWWLDLGRLLLGFSTGILSYVCVIYVAEISPKDFRGGFTMAIQLMVCGGVTLMYYIGNIISWRYLALVGTVPCLIQVIGLLFIPESPRWLAKAGREKEVKAALQWLRGKETDVSHEAADIQDSTRSFNHQPGSGISELVQKKYARPLIIGVGLSLVLPWTGTNGIVMYASSILKAAGVTGGIATTTIGLIQIPFSVLGVVLMDKFGRRPLLMADLAGIFLGSTLLGLAFVLQDLKLWKDVTPTIVLVSMLIYFASFALGAGLPFAIISEVLPIDIKGSAGSLATFANFLSSWIVAYAFNFLFQWNSAGVFFIFGSISALLILFVAKMLPETKGLSLEEIQALWTRELQ